METITEKAPNGATYLTDWMEVIPANCVFNKGVTGCGATTLAIKQHGHTILAMPFRGLVENKVASNPELLGIHGDMEREEEIIKYVSSHDTIKIATTYDSFPLVCDVLIEQGINPYKECFLFVDEWHILFNSYKFRNTAVTNLLERAKMFDRKTYVSATPIPREYWLTELQDLPEYRLEWPEATPININSNKVSDPLVYMARLCKARANNGGNDNYHIFLNSVEGIARIAKLAGLSPKDCRIVCSQSEESKERNQKKLGIYSISTNQDPVRLFNFYTSTCFEGQDILDPIGRTFIVSEPNKDHTKMDVMTSLLQICGRVRDSDYKTEINQFYAESKYKDVSAEEFKLSLDANVSEAKEVAELLDKIPEGERRARMIRDYVNKDPYIGVVDNKIVVDQNLANLEIVNYGIVNGQYKTQCNMNASLLNAGFQVTNDIEAYNLDEELESELSIAKAPFKDLFEEYVAIRTSKGFNLDCFRRSRIEIEKPLVKDAYEKLGADKVREMKYHQSNIKRELTKRMDETLDTKVFLLLDDQLPKQIAIPKSEIKTILQKVYDEMGIKRIAKATDLRRWYTIKETSKRADDGGIQASVSIISANITVAR